MKWLGRGRLRFFRGQGGFTLIEVVLAVGIIALIGVGVTMAIDTNARASRTLDEQVEAVNLATAYFEAIKQTDYSNNSTAYSNAGENITIPSQYNVDIDIDYSDDGITWVDTYTAANQTLQKITVSVSHGGKPVFSTCTYRADR